MSDLLKRLSTETVNQISQYAYFKGKNNAVMATQFEIKVCKHGISFCLDFVISTVLKLDEIVSIFFFNT